MVLTEAEVQILRDLAKDLQEGADWHAGCYNEEFAKQAAKIRRILKEGRQDAYDYMGTIDES